MSATQAATCPGGGTSKEADTVGTLFSAFDIARSGMAASQAQLDTAGHNIANVNTEGFSRQRVELETRAPINRPYGQLGRGVNLRGVERVRDAFLDEAYRRSAPGLGQAELESSFYAQIEDKFLEPEDNAFGQRLDGWFQALNDFASDVDKLPQRQSVVSEAESLTQFINQTHRRLDDLRLDANAEVRNASVEINDLAEGIAKLNNKIRNVEGGGRTANDFRDQRDLLLDKLSKIADISVNERESGEVNVLIGEESLVYGDQAREVEAFRQSDLDSVGIHQNFYQLRFSDTEEAVPPGNGKLGGALRMRDEILPEVMGDLDTIARGLIQGINGVHSQGRGLEAITGVLESGVQVEDPSAPLADQTPFDVTSGSFDIAVYEEGAEEGVTTEIAVDANASLEDLAGSLNAVDGVSAQVSDGRLAIEAEEGRSFHFLNDSSNVLVAAGLNGLLTGTGAADINIDQRISANPALLSSGYSADLGDDGDNRAALDLADVEETGILKDGQATISEFYSTMIAELGTDTRSSLQTRDLEQSFLDDFQRRREEVSGVSLDEEVAALLMYQRAFEASTRVMTTTDRMLEALMGIVQ